MYRGNIEKILIFCASFFCRKTSEEISTKIIPQIRFWKIIVFFYFILFFSQISRLIIWKYLINFDIPVKTVFITILKKYLNFMLYYQYYLNRYMISPRHKTLGKNDKYVYFTPTLQIYELFATKCTFTMHNDIFVNKLNYLNKIFNRDNNDSYLRSTLCWTANAF